MLTTWPEYSIIDADRRYVTEREKVTLDDALYIWTRVDTPGFRLVRAGNYPSGNVDDMMVFPIVEILKVK